MENRIYVSIPLDALIVSGITSDCAVQISAVDGAILRGAMMIVIFATAFVMNAKQKASASNDKNVQSSR